LVAYCFTIDYYGEDDRRRNRREDVECKVYVGDLSKDASEQELEKEFAAYGR